MDIKAANWLRSRIPEWERRGWLTAEGSRYLRERYVTAPPKAGPSMTRLLLLLMGTVLIGMGIFLLFAGYWYGFSPNGRFDWSLALVILSLAVLGAAVAKARRGGIFAEAATVFFMAVLSGSTFLMADTYYTGEAPGIYVLMVLILALPVIYIMESGIGMIVYLLGALVWSVSSNAVALHAEPLVLWGLLALGIPFYWQTIRRYKERKSLLLWLSWAYMGAALGALFFVIQSYNLSLAPLLVAAFSNATFALGSLSRNKGLWTLPLRGIGVLGLLYVVVSGTLLGTWAGEARITPGWFTALLAFLGVVGTLYLERRLWQAKLVTESIIGIVPLLLAILSGGVHFGLSPFMASAVFNVYIIFLAVVMCIRGTVEKRVGLFNGCVVMCLAMAGARFFDPAFTFVERGVIFLTAGFAVFAINAFYMWRKQSQKRWAKQTGKEPSEKAPAVTKKEGDASADEHIVPTPPKAAIGDEKSETLQITADTAGDDTKGGPTHEV